MTAQLTKRQLDVLRVFYELQTESGLAPTLSELGIQLGVNRVTVYGHAQALLEKGALENLMPGASRGLDVTSLGRDRLKGRTQSLGQVHGTNSPAGLSTRTNSGGTQRSVPLLGKIAAGGPILTAERQEFIDIPELLNLKPSTYLLQVSGDSMINAQIAHGDWVVVNSEKTAEAKDIVVAILTDGPQEECTLKTFIPLGKGKVRLQPENQDYEATIVDTQKLQIRGVVTAVLRSLS